MKIKYFSKILLLFILLFLLVGVISATDLNNDAFDDNDFMEDENFDVNDNELTKDINVDSLNDVDFSSDKSLNNNEKQSSMVDNSNLSSSLVKQDMGLLSDKRSEDIYTSSGYYESVQNTTSVKHPVELHIQSISNPCFGETIPLRGTLFVMLDIGPVPVGNQIIRITVNNNEFSAVTDSAGKIDINYTVDTYNKSRVTFYYAGSNLHQSITNYTTMTVKQPTTLYIYPRSGDKKGSTIKVSGKLLSNDVGVKGQLIYVYVNGIRYTLGSGSYGYFTTNYTITSYDDLNVTYDFRGSNNYAPCINSTVYTVLKPMNPTNLFMYSRSHDVLGSTIKISGKLLTNTTPVNGGVINITVNDKVYSAVSDFNGYFTVNHTIDSYDDLNVTFSYGGNASFSSCYNSTVYTVLKPMTSTNLYMYSRANDAVGSTIKVSGKLQSNGEGVKGEFVNISVNGVNYTAITGGYGYFTINHTIDSYDDLNVTFTYDGNALYLPTSNSTVYTVVKSENPTNLFIYPRSDDIYGTTIKVSGKLQSNGEGVKGEFVNISVNGVNYTAITGGYGYFTVNHTITSYDDLNVTCTYAGRGTYMGCSNSTVYTILKQRYYTEIFMYQRSGDKFGSTIKVSGKLLCNGVGVKGENMLIFINGVNYTAKTGGYGYFTVNYTITNYNDINVIFTFRSTGKYMGASNSTVYTVLKTGQPTNIFMYERHGDAHGTTIKVSGKLQSNGVGVRGEIINIRVNNNYYTAITGGYGYFTVNHTIMNYYGDVNVDFTYNGSKKYLSSSNSTVYPLINTQSPTNIFMYTRSGDSYGSTIKVSGKLLRNNTPVDGGVIRITVNEKIYSAVSDFNGYFTVNHTIDSYNDLNVTFSYAGNYAFLASTNSTVYSVKKPATFMLYPRGVISGNTIKFSGKLLSNDTGVKGAKININVNGKIFAPKTDSNGYFVIYYTSEVYEDHTLVCSFAGNGNYEACDVTKTFYLKQTAYMSIFSSDDYWVYGEVKTLRGRLLSDLSYNVPIRNQNVTILINDESFTVVSDDEGYFNFNYTVTDTDKKTLIYRFDGNTFYEEVSRNFTVEHFYRPTNIIIDSMEVSSGSDVLNVRVRIMSLGEPINSKRPQVSLIVNGVLVESSISPDSGAYVAFNYLLDYYGSYDIEVNYKQYYPYLGSTNTTTFVYTKS